MSIAASVVVPVAVALLSFTASLDMAVADVKRTVARPRALVAGLVAQLSVLPAVALLLGLAGCPPLVMAALILVALAPSGPTSNYLAALARGDLPLSVLMTVFGTLISVLTIPAFLPLLLPLAGLQANEVGVPAMQLLGGMVVTVLIPVAAGMALAKKHPEAVMRWRPRMARVASAVFALLVIGAIAAEREALGAVIVKAGLWVVGANLLTMAGGALFAKLAGLDQARAVTFALKCAVQNVSIALVISITMMQRLDIAAIAALYGIVQLLTATGFVLVRRRGAAAA